MTTGTTKPVPGRRLTETIPAPAEYVVNDGEATCYGCSCPSKSYGGKPENASICEHVCHDVYRFAWHLPIPARAGESSKW